MIKPTLEHPHAIIEDVSEAKEGDTTERPSSYVFIRSFKKLTVLGIIISLQSQSAKTVKR